MSSQAGGVHGDGDEPATWESEPVGSEPIGAGRMDSATTSGVERSNDRVATIVPLVDVSDL